MHREPPGQQNQIKKMINSSKSSWKRHGLDFPSCFPVIANSVNLRQFENVDFKEDGSHMRAALAFRLLVAPHDQGHLADRDIPETFEIKICKREAGAG